ncbi:MAG: CehA/McbA family metallohydrolase [Bacteroidota bacterium]
MRPVCLCVLAMLFAATCFAQTNPAAQAVPYSQDFNTLLHTSTTYPAGWQGWQTGTSITTAFRTTTTGDRLLTASSTASTNSGNVHNFNGKIGFLTSGSLDVALALSLNTSGKTAVLVAYDAMTIRNPYDGTANTKIAEMTLQYRVGTSGAFINLTGIEYQTNTTPQTTAVTTPQNLLAKSITLPAACDDKPVVQIRWASRDVSGAGSRPSLAVDNIVITANTIPGTTVSIGPGLNAAEPVTNGSFSITLSAAAPVGGITVTYTLTGTATIVSDYTDPQSGSITIPQGSSAGTININTVNDGDTEPTETIIATINTVTAPYTVSNGMATINLADDGDITPISYTGITYTQDFNTLATTGTSSVLPTGWLFAETGTNANTSYTANNGGSTSGDTYSFGTGTASDRALGGLRSGSLVPSFGAIVKNNSGATLSTLVVSYTGEQWRVGALNRADRLDFQYSTNATNLTSGTWTNVDALDFTGPVVTPVGAVDGNLPGSSVAISFIIKGLAVANGANIVFRWVDFDASGSDDGLGIDNVSFSPGCTPPTNQPTALNLVPSIEQIQGSFTNAAPGAINPDRYLVVMNTVNSLTEQPSSGTTYAVDDLIGGGRVVAITDGSMSNAFTVSELTPGTPYYFFVYSFTNASDCYNITNPLTGSQSTTTPPPCTAPATQVSGVSAGPITSTAINLVYTRGTGDNILILARTGSPVTSEPINSINYTMGNSIGAGNVIIYKGAASSFNYAGLTANTTYHFALFEFNSADNCYRKPGVTANFTTACSAPINVSALVANAGNTQTSITWTNPTASCFDEVLVVVSGSAINGDGNTYGGAGNSTYLGGGSPQVVFRGLGSGVTVTGLANGTTYYVKVFTRLNPTYSSGVQVTVTPFDPSSGYTYLFGNLHAHSSYSDGNKDNLANTPNEDFIFARDALCMDYMGMSEHNHSQAGMNYPDYLTGFNQANALNLATGPGGNSIVTLWGMEWGVISGGGHVLVYGFDDKLLGWEAGNYDILVPKNDYASLWTTVTGKAGAIATLAHPSSGDYGALASTYNATADNAIVGVAVESGPAFSTSTTYNDPPSSRLGFLSYYKNMLSKGFHLAPQMDQDNHNMTFGTANANRTVVLASAKTRDAVMDALRSGRYYASQDCNLSLDFRLGAAHMGGTVVQAGDPTITLTANDVNGEAVTSIELWGGEAGNNIVPAAPIRTYTDVNSFTFLPIDPENNQQSGQTYYYYAIITQADGDRAVTAPIWYVRNDLILPVTFISLVAAYDPTTQTAAVSWSTVQEFNSKEFVIERSADGINFTSIGAIAGSYNSQTLRQYRFTDQQPLNGISYYRIRQVDTDGRFMYSPVGRITVGKNNNGHYLVYPNPARGSTYVHSTHPFLEKVTVLVLDNLGRVLASKNEMVGSANPLKLDVSGYKTGAYFIKVIGNQTITTEKVLVY